MSELERRIAAATAKLPKKKPKPVPKRKAALAKGPSARRELARAKAQLVRFAASLGFELVETKRRAPQDTEDDSRAARRVKPITPSAVDPRQADLPHHVRTCNRHDDCDLADEIARKSGKRVIADHCHLEGCDECKR